MVNKKERMHRKVHRSSHYCLSKSHKLADHRIRTPDRVFEAEASCTFHSVSVALLSPSLSSFHPQLAAQCPSKQMKQTRRSRAGKMWRSMASCAPWRGLSPAGRPVGGSPKDRVLTLGVRVGGKGFV